MPLKRGNKTYKDFGSLKAALKKEGKSDLSATKIAAEIMHRQEGTKKKKR